MESYATGCSVAKIFVRMLKRRSLGSTLPYHITIAARRRPEQSHPTYIHPRTEVYAGTDNEVCVRLSASGSSLTIRNSFMAHPETHHPMPEIEDPTQRFVSVVKFYLSGWHIKPPYVGLCWYREYVGISG